MARRRERLLAALRRFNRAWLDRLDPHDPPAPVSPPPRVRAHLQIEPEVTPNPHAMKFNCHVQVQQRSFTSLQEAAGDPLGEALFALSGVRSVFAVNDFVTVIKQREVPWERLDGAIREALQTHIER